MTTNKNHHSDISEITRQRDDLKRAAEAIMPHLDTDLLAHEPWQKEIDALRLAIQNAPPINQDQGEVEMFRRYR